MDTEVGFEAVLMKSYVFWDTTPCGTFKVNKTFRRKCPLHHLGWRVNQASCWSLAWLTLNHCRWRRHVLPKHRLNFNGLHCVISHYRTLRTLKYNNLTYNQYVLTLNITEWLKARECCEFSEILRQTHAVGLHLLKNLHSFSALITYLGLNTVFCMINKDSPNSLSLDCAIRKARVGSQHDLVIILY
jgi:hypothetical protein